jgi:hypothetical protein
MLSRGCASQSRHARFYTLLKWCGEIPPISWLRYDDIVHFNDQELLLVLPSLPAARNAVELFFGEFNLTAFGGLYEIIGGRNSCILVARINLVGAHGLLPIFRGHFCAQDTCACEPQSIGRESFSSVITQ